MRSALLVGSLLIASAVALTWFVMATSKDKFDESSTYPLYADFSDAAGIRWKTRVQINGIDVGKIDGITHERGSDGRLVARVALRVLNEYQVYANAEVRKAAESLLGDFRVDMKPGGVRDWCSFEKPCSHGGTCVENSCMQPCGDASVCEAGQQCVEGACGYALLTAGQVIRRVQSVSDIDEIQSQLKQVARNVSDVTDSFSHVLSGPEGEGSLKAILQRVERSMEAIEMATSALSGTLTRNDRLIDNIVNDLHTFTSSMASATGSQGSVTRITDNLADMTQNLERVSRSLTGMIEGEGDGVAEEGASVRDAITTLNESVSNLAAITRKIDDGEGSIGRFINDSTIADQVEQTLEDTSELIGGLSRLKTQIELRSQYEVPYAGGSNTEIQAAMKNTLAVRIVPKPDKYYIIEAVSDPRGNSTRSITTTTTDASGAQSVSKVEENVISFDELKFSAQFAKRYYFLTLRFGIIESTGGLGFNLHGWQDNLELRIDLFDFSRRHTDNPDRRRMPRLRSTAMLQFVKHLHAQAGVDDPFNNDLSTWFLGGVLRFTDEDLKALLTVMPSP